AERLSRIRGISIEQAKEIIELKRNENIITQDQADLAMGLSKKVEDLSDAYLSLIDAMIQTNEQGLKQQNITVTLYNSLGQEMMVPIIRSGKLHENTLKLELPDNLSSGLYMIKINTANRSWTRSIVRP
ncbi:MAG: T9SS type A sorting domain-containing protein, partial [Bacteroidia bacterium]